MPRLDSRALREEVLGETDGELAGAHNRFRDEVFHDYTDEGRSAPAPLPLSAPALAAAAARLRRARFINTSILPRPGISNGPDPALASIV